jgi:hypothetical protein
MKKCYTTFLLLLLFSAYSHAQNLTADEQVLNQLQPQATVAATQHNATSFITSNKALQVVCDSLTTIYNTNNGLAGCMFNITAATALTLDHLYANLYTGTSTYAISYKTGSYVGFNASPGAWTVIDSATITATQNVPQLVPIPLNISMNAGDTIAFYFTRTTGTGGMKYTDGTQEGALYASNSDMSIYQGIGVAYPFGLVFTPRIWNGTVVYCKSPVGIGEVSDAFMFNPVYQSALQQFSITLDAKLFHDVKNISFELTDINGKLVNKTNISRLVTTLSAAGLAKGIYMCTLTNGQHAWRKKVAVY